MNPLATVVIVSRSALTHSVYLCCLYVCISFDRSIYLSSFDYLYFFRLSITIYLSVYLQWIYTFVFLFCFRILRLVMPYLSFPNFLIQRCVRKAWPCRWCVSCWCPSMYSSSRMTVRTASSCNGPISVSASVLTRVYVLNHFSLSWSAVVAMLESFRDTDLILFVPFAVVWQCVSPCWHCSPSC